MVDAFKESERIEYSCGFKYQLRNDAWFYTGIVTKSGAVTELVSLRPDGWLLIRKYFCWDGGTFPAIDTKTNARACLIHDALYYLMRVGKLEKSYKKDVDRLLRKFMLRDGAWPFRAMYFEIGVNLFGASACSSIRRVYTAP